MLPDNRIPMSGNSMPEPSSLSFAAILPKGPLRAWQEKCLRTVTECGGATLVCTFSCGAEEARPADIVTAYVRKVVDSAFTEHTGPSVASGVPSRPLPRTGDEAFPSFDFILDFTGTHMPERVRSLAPHGVWSFLLGEESGPGLSMACVVETLRDRGLLHGVLYKQGERASEGIVLRRFSVKNSHGSLRRNIRAMVRVSVDALPGACATIAFSNARRGGESIRFQSKPRLCLYDLLPLLGNRLKGAFRKKKDLFFVENWNVGIVDMPIKAFLTRECGKIGWLFKHSDRWFWADPFGVPLDDGIRVFYEKYDKKKKIGLLGQAVFSGVAEESPNSPHDADHHQSYPYVFKHDDQLFAVPESSQKGRVELYKVDPETGLFHSPVTILDEVLSDPTLFRYEGRWWLYGIRSRFRLFLWHADSLTGPWIEHPLNPIVIDPASARPGGTPFIHEGALYRPAQDCSKQYGGAVAICKVEELTLSSYSERVVKRIYPEHGSQYPDGVHTLSSAGEKTLLDGKKMRFSLRPFSQAITQRFSRDKK